MVRGRSTQPAIDVVFVSGSAVSGTSKHSVAALLAALRDQGITPAETITIDDADPRIARSRLAEALAGPNPVAAPDPSPAPGATPRAVGLLDARIVVNAPPLGAVLDDPRVSTGALARAQHGRQLFLGVLKVDGAARAAAATLVSGLPAEPGKILLDLTRALSGSGLPVQPIALGGYAWASGSQIEDAAGKRELATAVQAIAAIDERRVRLREAARGGDGFYSTFVLRKLSWRLTAVAERTGLTPNQVTLISFGLGLVAAGLLAGGSRLSAVLGAILLQVCLVVDCVDGELARYRRRFSRFGAWLDASTDRIKEFAAIAGLAVGAAASSRAGLWWLVAAAIAVQTFRNLFDLGWALRRADGGGSPDASGVAAAADQGPQWVSPPTGVLAPAAPTPGPGAASWLRRIGHFPIGERFLLISLGAAFLSPRPTLILLLLAGLLSAAYMIAAYAVRVVRGGSSGAVTASFARRIAGLADTGPTIAALLRRVVAGPLRRVGPVLPAVIAAAELALIWVLGRDVAGARPSAVVLLVAVTAIAHYQHAYQVREESAQVGRLVVGTDLRLLALLVGVLLPSLLLSGTAGGSWATAAVCALAAVVAASSTVRSLRGWRDSAPDDGTGPDADPALDTDPALYAGPGAATASTGSGRATNSAQTQFQQTSGGNR